MPYNWQDQSEGQREEFAPPIPDGEHDLKIAKVKYTSKKKPGGFKSADGFPQILLIIMNAQGCEAPLMITLSPKGAWVLRRLLGCFDPPADLATMEKEGVEPEMFALAEYGDGLIDRKFRAKVTNKKDSAFPDIEPIKGAKVVGFVDTNEEAEPPPAAADEPPPVVDDDPPPVVDEPPPVAVIYTKDSAWKTVIANWDAGVKVNPATKEVRNKKWADAIKVIAAGRAEAALTNDDWAKIVAHCEVPF